MSTGDPTHYEVDVDFLVLVDPAGYPHFLTHGRELPEWVAPSKVAELVNVGALFKYGVI